MELPCLSIILSCIWCPYFLLQVIILRSYSASLPSNTTDKLALLSFKYAISDDPFQAFASWNDSIDYCRWPGVTCSTRHTDRVTALELDSLNLNGLIPPSLANLTFLQRLKLSDNRFDGPIPSELGALSRLKYLNLTSNSLDGVIPQSLSQCSRIKLIDLKGNNLQGEIPSNLSSCVNLQILRLSNNQLAGEIPGKLSSLPNLVYLDLGRNNLEGSIPPSLGNLSSLLAIDLSQNTLSGEIPSTFEQLTSLAFLYLYRNSLSGRLLPFYNLSSLVYLDLSYNNLSGSISPSLGNLSSLIKIDFTTNTLSGPIPPSLGSLPYLSELYFTANSFTGHIPASLGFLPSLTILGLSHNKLSGEIPPSLYNLSTLRGFGIASNQLVGTLPEDIGHTLPNLEGISLYYNQFHGPLPMSLANASRLADVELTGNSFSGMIPPNLGTLRDLFWLSLDRNQFEGGDTSGWSFLNSLANCSNLQVLSLEFNRLGGVLPDSVANLSTSLERLTMGGNQISGGIPPGIGNLVNLTIIGLDRNILTGSLPATIGKLQRLQELFLLHNNLTGTIPSSLGNLSQLSKLDLADNLFAGTISPALGDCQALRHINLSYNQLTGPIPKEVVSISSLTEQFDLSYNSLSGSLPSEVGLLKNLVNFDVSGNKLFGEIPSTIGDCQVLNTLHLEGNLFQGAIPSTMRNLKGIQDLDLSRNNLSGPIPKFLQDFRFLQNLNLSLNNFEGEVPMQGIFRNLSALSVFGNDNLCGGDPELGLAACATGDNERGNGSRRIKVIITVTIVSLCFLLLVCLLVYGYWLRHRRTEAQPTDSMEERHHVKVSYSQIRKATDEFSSANLIGVGSFGSVYKGTMYFGVEKYVAIKVLNLQRQGASKSFMAECNALRGIRHRNLIKILTSCASVDHNGNDFKALVFEYMPNGSLEKWLHPVGGMEGEGRKLNMEQRLNIAIDVASALDYLHHHGPMPIVHCDLKPTNILLDDDMTAHVGDFGLAKFLTGTADKSSKSSIGVKGTVGYIAPEYGVANKVSTHGDVYSYGILLLEMFTGVRPTGETLKEGINLPRFVEMALPGHVTDIADPYLLGQEDGALRQKEQECLVTVLEIGLSCCKVSPRERIQMGEVTREMQAIRDMFAGTKIQEEKRNKGKIEDEGPSVRAHYVKS